VFFLKNILFQIKCYSKSVRCNYYRIPQYAINFFLDESLLFTNSRCRANPFAWQRGRSESWCGSGKTQSLKLHIEKPGLFGSGFF